MTSTTPSDRGWNDPPAKLPETDGSITTTRVSLNKRVPFTDQKSSTTEKNFLTTPPSSSVSTTITSAPNAENNDDEVKFSNIDQLKEIFIAQLQKLDEAKVEKKILDDLTKKFSIMEDEWKQLTCDTKQKLSGIFQQLDNGNSQEAFDLHVLLVRNSGSEVVRFIVGIKRLIQELQRLSSSSSSSSTPSFSTPSSFFNSSFSSPSIFPN